MWQKKMKESQMESKEATTQHPCPTIRTLARAYSHWAWKHSSSYMRKEAWSQSSVFMK